MGDGSGWWSLRFNAGHLVRRATGAVLRPGCPCSACAAGRPWWAPSCGKRQEMCPTKRAGEIRKSSLIQMNNLEYDWEFDVFQTWKRIFFCSVQLWICFAVCVHDVFARFYFYLLQDGMGMHKTTEMRSQSQKSGYSRHRQPSVGI